jgi:hypothetical protein
VRPRAVPATGPIFADVRQVCTVVDDFEPTIQNLVDHLGIGPFRCWHFRPPRLYSTTYRGEPEKYSMKLAMTWLDDVQWEVITPVDGRTMYRDHLETRGRGVQHILMGTGEIPFEAAVEHLAQRGHPFGQTAKLNAEVQIRRVTLPSMPNKLAGPMSLQFGYVDAEATMRSSFELTRYPLGFSERFALRSGKPEFCIPEGNARFERPLPTRRVGRVAKITIVTRDVDATVRNYVDVVRVGPWRIFEVGPERSARLQVDGVAGRFRAKVAWGFVGDTLFELVEPLDGASPYRHVLDTRGEGVAAVGVLPGREGFDALLDHCKSLGYSVSLRGALRGDHPSAYLGARRWIGTDLEIVAPPSDTFKALFHGGDADRVLGS